MRKLQINNFDEEIYIEKLSNGLEVYLLPMKLKKNYSVFLGTRYGGKDINFKIDDKEYHTPTGIAHFLEHKLFEQEESPFAFYSKSGTDVNAQTTSDYTGYYFNGNQNFNENLKYLLSWITHFNIDDEKVKKEQGIILEEASMYKDNPTRVLYDKIKENTYVIDTNRYKVIGSDEDIKKITKEDLKLCYRAFYRPDNMFLIVVGSFDVDETLKIIKQELKHFKNPKEHVEKLIYKEKDEVYKVDEVIKLNAEIPKIACALKINKALFSDLNLSDVALDEYLFMLVSLSLGSASDFREYLLLNHLFTTVNYQFTKTDFHYVLEVYANSKYPDKLFKALKEHVKKIELKEEEFTRLKKTWIAGEIRIIDSIQACLYNILDDIVDYQEFQNKRIEQIRSLSFETLKKVYERIDFKNYCKVVIK